MFINSPDARFSQIERVVVENGDSGYRISKNKDQGCVGRRVSEAWQGIGLGFSKATSDCSPTSQTGLQRAVPKYCLEQVVQQKYSSEF